MPLSGAYPEGSDGCHGAIPASACGRYVGSRWRPPPRTEFGGFAEGNAQATPGPVPFNPLREGPSLLRHVEPRPHRTWRGCHGSRAGGGKGELTAVGVVDATLPPEPKPSLARQLTWWVLVFPVAMTVAVIQSSMYWLDFVHVMSGALWTGTDIFMGFILGPILRRLDPPQRKAVIGWLTPRTLLYLPVLAFTTGTAGWILSTWMGIVAPMNPARPWVIAALVIIAILAVQGFGILLPNSLRTYRELQKPVPDLNKIFRLNRQNNMLAGFQGVLQVAIILVMAHLAVG